jgi:porphobilinogen synthase
MRYMEFPATRLRRLRATPAMRSLVRETHLRPGALVYPLFLCEGEGVYAARSARCRASSTYL